MAQEMKLRQTTAARNDNVGAHSVRPFNDQAIAECPRRISCGHTMCAPTGRFKIIHYQLSIVNCKFPPEL